MYRSFKNTTLPPRTSISESSTSPFSSKSAMLQPRRMCPMNVVVAPVRPRTSLPATRLPAARRWPSTLPSGMSPFSGICHAIVWSSLGTVSAPELSVTFSSDIRYSVPLPVFMNADSSFDILPKLNTSSSVRMCRPFDPVMVAWLSPPSVNRKVALPRTNWSVPRFAGEPSTVPDFVSIMVVVGWSMRIVPPAPTVELP